MGEVIEQPPAWLEARRVYLNRYGTAMCNAWQSGYDAYGKGRPYNQNSFSGEKEISREYWYAWREGWMTAADQADVVDEGPSQYHNTWQRRIGDIIILGPPTKEFVNPITDLEYRIHKEVTMPAFFRKQVADVLEKIARGVPREEAMPSGLTLNFVSKEDQDFWLAGGCLDCRTPNFGCPGCSV